MHTAGRPDGGDLRQPGRCPQSRLQPRTGLEARRVARYRAARARGSPYCALQHRRRTCRGCSGGETRHDLRVGWSRNAQLFCGRAPSSSVAHGNGPSRVRGWARGAGCGSRGQGGHLLSGPADRDPGRNERASRNSGRQLGPALVRRPGRADSRGVPGLHPSTSISGWASSPLEARPTP